MDRSERTNAPLRESKTADEIRNEVKRLVDEGITLSGKTNNTDIGPVLRHLTPDYKGCNWYVSHMTHAGDHLAEVGAALANVKSRWNLAD